MYKKLLKFLKLIIISSFWLVFPPLFYWLAKLWFPVHKELRRVSFILSPLVVFLIFYFLFYITILSSDALMGSKWNIERKTELEFPSYSRNNFRFFLLLLQENSMSSFHGDHGLQFQARLKPSQCDEFFENIEQLINDSTYSNPNDKGILTRSWSMDRNGNYSFYYLREQPGEAMGITISPTTYEMSVSFGTW